MKVQVRYTERTCLEPLAFLKLARKFCYGLKYKTIISFDGRIKNYGHYIFDSKRKTHIIRISPNRKEKETSIHKHIFISTLIHELRHAHQKEKKGVEFWTKKYICSPEIKLTDFSTFFSLREIDARIFENKNILQAIKIYNNFEKRISIERSTSNKTSNLS